MAYALITGGSQELGFELAKCFADDGIDLILCARNQDRLNTAAAYLKEKYGVDVKTVAIDLSEKDAAERLHEECGDKKISHLVNNAGIGFLGEARRIPKEKDEQLIALNITALTGLTKLFLSDMLAAGSGTILNVASTGAFVPGPYIASYYASKAYVLSYTEALAQETAGSSVKVCCLCPGPVRTSFYGKSGQTVPFYAMDAEKCARYAYRKMKEGETLIIPGVLNRLSRHLPAGLSARFVGKMKSGQLKDKKDG